VPSDVQRFAAHALWIFVVSMLGGIVPLLHRWSAPQLQTLISASAGIILGVLFFDLLPAISNATPHFYSAVLAGFVLLLVLERFVLIHPHETEELAGRRSGLTAYLGISLHSLLDGLALGSGVLMPELAPAVLFAILAHKVPDTFSLTSILTFFGYSRRSTLLMLILFSLLTPLGGSLALLLFQGVPPQALGLALGLATGTFLFIATSDLLPHAHASHERRYRNLAVLLLGIAAIYVTRHGARH
jgi:zinc transporter ZupT